MGNESEHFFYLYDLWPSFILFKFIQIQVFLNEILYLSIVKCSKNL